MIRARTKNRSHDSRRWSRIVPAILLLIFLAGGCKEAVYTSIELPEEGQGRAAGLLARAVYLSEPDEIKDLFGDFLPARGVLPILVTIRNNDTEALRLHSRNGLPLRDEFSGFLLFSGVDTLEPIHPLDVVRIIRDDGSSRTYRKSDGVDVVTGVLLPPLGAWYAWEEYRSRREFKPLVEASLYPANFGGTFEPLILSPGEEASGYLYFEVDKADIPYDSAMAVVEKSGKVDFSGKKKSETIVAYRLKEDWNGGLRLSCRPSSVETVSGEAGSFAPVDSLPSSQVFFPAAGRDGDGTVERMDGFFALVAGESGSSLVFGRPGPGGQAIASSGLSVITDFSGDGMEISSAAVMDDLAVCAIHFTRRSRVIVVDLAGGGARLINTVEFDRNTEKVFFLRGEHGSVPEALAFTSNDFCHLVPLGNGGKSTYMKLGNDIEAIAVDSRDRLLVFAGDELRTYRRGVRRLFEPVSEAVPGKFEIDVVGEAGERLVMLGRGRKGAGDTLRVFDTRLTEELSGMALPARVALVGKTDGGLLVHLEEGTLLHLGIDSGGGLSVRDSAYFPVRFTAMTMTGEVLTLFRDDGVILTGTMDGGLPAAPRGGIVIPVDLAPPRPVDPE